MLRHHLSDPEWLVTETGFSVDLAGRFETLLTVGNGFLGTRGTLEEGHRGDRSGTFLAGVYDDNDAAVTDLVNAPDWTPITVYCDGTRLDVQNCRVVSHERALDMRRGLLWRETVFEDSSGRRTRVESLRLASMSDRHICAIRLEVTPLDHAAPIRIVGGLDGHRRNLDRLPQYPPDTVFENETAWGKWALSRHLDHSESHADSDSMALRMRTISSGVEIDYAAALIGPDTAEHSWATAAYEHAEQGRDTFARSGETIRVDKIVAIRTSREAMPGDARVLLESVRPGGFDAILREHVDAWARLWESCDIRIVGDERATHAARFSVYHLLIAANPDDPTVNIGAKSLSGEGYRGHVFWDTEVLMLPFFIYTRPDTARSLLAYRHHVLPAARDLAHDGGHSGARYPWESADTGREECPLYTNDGAHRFWTRDEEIHVTADVAYGVMSYVTATGDRSFLLDGGAEILFEAARFWASRVEPDDTGDTLRLRQVMGPDEFHSHVDDNAFTNELARWNLQQADRVHHWLAASHVQELQSLRESIELRDDEADEWRAVAKRITHPLVNADGVIEQFSGYFERGDVAIVEWDENDMPKYPEGFDHFNCEETMLLKQPDVVMLMHMLPDAFSADAKKANFEYYESRTLHKSSLSPAIHAIMGLTVGDPTRALQYFYRSALVDLADNQGNTREGIHIASCGGTWQTLVHGFAGFRIYADRPAFDPHLPDEWAGIEFRLQWRGIAIDVSLGLDEGSFLLHAPAGTTQLIYVAGHAVTLSAGTAASVPFVNPRVHETAATTNTPMKGQ